MLESTTVALPKSRAQVRVECPSPIAAATPLERILRFPPLVQWLDALDTQMADRRSAEIAVRRITVQSVDEFRPGAIGFVKFITDAVHAPDGRRVPGIVFLRGAAVAVLVILRTPASPRARVPSWRDTDCVVLVEQPRVAVPDFALRELPAGMLDGDADGGGFVGTAAREIREETGLEIAAADLVDLTPAHGLYPSPGACDEAVRLFACEKRLAEPDLDALRGRLAGLRAEGELITLRLTRLCDLWRETRDMQAVAALYMWDRHNDNNDAPPPHDK
ncbi:hypothetical protein H4R18_000720 [Coemansia javaensis]|uniref:Nudix hydrolase domain-containing protein n=1 Tax=Coemansia javaensis TaxID=2761396 RepID=A0A9W8HF87_9FUNG|nr:hypothetical protein H4R18_000720 [Coemansia javaensis]